jgi:hypothetical protein
MRFRGIVTLMMIAPTFLGPTRGQERSPERPPQLIIFERQGAPGKIEAARLCESLKITMKELQAPAEPLPVLFVFHINESEADVFGVKETSVWRTDRDGGVRYELWILGMPTDETYSGLAEIFLERHFGVAIEDAERKRVVHAVKARLAGMVSVEVLRQNKLAGMKSPGPVDRRK